MSICDAEVYSSIVFDDQNQRRIHWLEYSIWHQAFYAKMPLRSILNVLNSPHLWLIARAKHKKSSKIEKERIVNRNIP